MRVTNEKIKMLINKFILNPRIVYLKIFFLLYPIVHLKINLNYWYICASSYSVYILSSSLIQGLLFRFNYHLFFFFAFNSIITFYMFQLFVICFLFLCQIPFFCCKILYWKVIMKFLKLIKKIPNLQRSHENRS